MLALTCLELLTWKDKYSQSPRWHWDPTCPRPGQIWGSVTKVRPLMSPPHLSGATQTCRTQELSQCQGWRNGGTLSCRVCSMELTWGERAGPEPPWCHQSWWHPSPVAPTHAVVQPLLLSPTMVTPIFPRTHPLWHPAHPQHPPHAPTSPCPQTQHRRCRLSGPQGDTKGTGCGGLLGGSPATCARRFICKDRHGGGHGDVPAPAWGLRCPQVLGGAMSLSTEPWPRAPCHHWGRGSTCAPLTLGSPPMSPGSAAVPKPQDPDSLAVPAPRNVPRLSRPAPPLPPSPPHPSDMGPSQGDGPHLVGHFFSKQLG